MRAGLREPQGCGRNSEMAGKNRKSAGENRKWCGGSAEKEREKCEEKMREMRKGRARNLVNAEKDAGENRKKVRGEYRKARQRYIKG